MAEVSFGAGSIPAEQVQQEAPSTQLPATLPAPGTQLPATNLPTGDYVPGFDDIVVPVLNLVHNIGDLKEMFTPGELVFNQQSVLYSPPKIVKGQVEKPGTSPLIITCIGWGSMRYSEKVEGGGRGIVVKSEQEVTQNGGTLDWNEWKLKKASGMKRFEELATGLFAIQRPDWIPDDGAVFNYELDGNKYVLAKWHFHGSSFTAACKQVLFYQRKMGNLINGYYRFSYAVTTREKLFSQTGNKAWIPVLVPNKPSSQAMVDFAAMVLKG
jgi:hypothetical protein